MVVDYYSKGKVAYSKPTTSIKLNATIMLGVIGLVHCTTRGSVFAYLLPAHLIMIVRIHCGFLCV